MNTETLDVTPTLGIPFRLGATARPFLKWAGGKSKLLPHLQSSVPSKFARYFEPFLGGGALYFHLRPQSAVLNDSNQELINCYEIVRDSPDQLIEALSKMPVSSAHFYALRAQQSSALGQVERAARVIYLNKTCYNGLFRVNRRGEFNVPYGKCDSVSIFHPDVIHSASGALKGAVLMADDFESCLKLARSEDFVYLDPPYVPISRYADFKRYTKEQFRADDQRRLAELAQALADRGCYVLVSNSNHPEVRELYANFEQRVVRVPRFVNCKGDRRGLVEELLISNYKAN